jgi:hypothetical protein
VNEFSLTGVRLALRSSGLTKLADMSADDLAAALNEDAEQEEGERPTPITDRKPRDPKEPSNYLRYTQAGPFGGDSLTQLGLNPYDTADFAY